MELCLYMPFLLKSTPFYVRNPISVVHPPYCCNVSGRKKQPQSLIGVELAIISEPNVQATRASCQKTVCVIYTSMTQLSKTPCKNGKQQICKE